MFAGAALFIGLVSAAFFLAPARWMVAAVMVGFGAYLLFLAVETPPVELSREAIGAWDQFGDDVGRKVELGFGILSSGIGLVVFAMLIRHAVRRARERSG